MTSTQKPLTGKLFQLKEWVTIPEAAEILSSIFHEDVNESDVLRLGIDNHLTISVNFVNGTYGRIGEVVSLEKIEWKEVSSFMDSGEKIPENIKGNSKKTREFIQSFPKKKVMKSIPIDEDRFINFEDKVYSIGGIWDLSRYGGALIDISAEYYDTIGGLSYEYFLLEGIFVEKEGEKICHLQTSYDENPFTDGSMAQLESINEKIACDDVSNEEGRKLLEKHKKDREKFIRQRDEHSSIKNFYPSNHLPPDSLLVIRTQSVLNLQNKLFGCELDKQDLDPRLETTYLNIIGALLEYIEGNAPGTDKHSAYESRAKLIDLFSSYEIRGLAKSTLENKFASATRSFKSN